MTVAARTRAIGALYLLYFVAAVASMGLARGIYVPGDPAATLAHLGAHESAYRAACLMGMLSNVLYLALVACFARLFATAGRTTTIFATVAGMCGCAVQLVGSVAQLMATTVLPGGLLATLPASDRAVIVAVSFAAYSQAYAVSLVLFACFDLAIGCLIVQSRLVPRAIGWLVIAAGVGWLAFLWPPLAESASAVILPLGAFAEFVLMSWMLIRGVDTSSSLRDTVGEQAA